MTTYDQFCPVARAAEIVGERWTLLIFRELLLSPKRFSDLQRRLSPITPGVLSERLRDLEAHGLIAREEVGPPTPARLFVLTPAGRAIEPAMHALVRWGVQFLFPLRPGDAIEPDWARAGLAAFCRLEPTPGVRIALRVHAQGKMANIFISGGPEGTFVTETGANPDATIAGDFIVLFALITGQLPLGAAVASGQVTVEGDLEAAAQLPGLFEVPALDGSM